MNFKLNTISAVLGSALLLTTISGCTRNNDTQNNAKSGNAGIKLAIAAIQHHGGFVFIPRAIGGGGDANDVHSQRGLTQLQCQLGSPAHYITQREAIHFDGAFCWLKK